MNNLDQRLWLEGNLSIGYGKNISNNGDIFSLKFNPQEVVKALDIPINKVNIEINSWYPGLFKKDPAQVVCFPYAQHFLSDSPGFASNLKNKKELEHSLTLINFNKIKVFSTKAFKIMFLVGGILSFVVTIILLILLIIS